MIQVQCPGCGQRMQTAPKRVTEGVKRCVYCGRSFKIHTPGGVSRVALLSQERPQSVEFQNAL